MTYSAFGKGNLENDHGLFRGRSRGCQLTHAEGESALLRDAISNHSQTLTNDSNRQRCPCYEPQLTIDGRHQIRLSRNLTY